MRLTLAVFLILINFMGCENHQTDIKNKEPFRISLAPQALGNNPVDVNSQLILDVNDTLQTNSVNDTTVYIQEVSTHIKPPIGVILIDQQIVIKPTIYLKISTDYQIVITTSVLTHDGKHLTTNLAIPFTTASTSPDQTSPTLVQRLPQNLASDVAPFSIIYFQFSEAIPTLYTKNLQIDVKDSFGNPIAGKTQYIDALVSFIPDTNFTANTHYVAQLDTTNIKDIAGNSFVGQTLETINFDVNTTNNIGSGLIHNPITYATKATVNNIISDKSILFIGTTDGLDIVRFDFDSLTSSFTYMQHLPQSIIGNVYTIDINSSSHRAYVGSSKGLFILDISDINNTNVINNYPKVVSITNPIQVYGLDIANDIAYIAAANHGLIMLDISNENHISTQKTIDTDGTAFDVKRIGTTIVVADYNKGIKTFNLDGILQPASPMQFASLDRILLSTNNPDIPYCAASGIGGVKYLNTISNIYDTISSASFVSNLTYDFVESKGYAIVKHVGFASFYISSSITPLYYQYLPYDITAINFLTIDGGIYVVFVASENGEIHAYINFPT